MSRLYDWYPGQKVVCVDDLPRAMTPDQERPWPRLGGVYTVRRVSWSREKHTGIPGVGLALAELEEPGKPRCFSDWRFKPAEEAAAGPAPAPQPPERPGARNDGAA